MFCWLCACACVGGGSEEAPLDLFRPQSAMILRSAVQNDLMLRNRRVSRVRAELPWRHFLHSDNAALLSLPFTSSAGGQQRGVWTSSVPFSLLVLPLVFSQNHSNRGKTVSPQINWTFTVVIQSSTADPSTFCNPTQTSELLEIAIRKYSFFLDVKCINGCLNNPSPPGFPGRILWGTV